MSAEEKIYEAAEEAVSVGLSPRDFCRMAAEGWDEALRQRKESDAQEWADMLRRAPR